MTQDRLSDLCLGLCYSKPRFPFPRLLAEIDGLVGRYYDQPTRMILHHDDHATLRVAGTNLGLFWTDAPGQRLAGVLSLAASADTPGPQPKARALLDLLVAHLHDRIEIDRLIWRRLRGRIDSDRIEALAQNLPPQSAPDLPGALAPRPTGKARRALL